MPKEQDKILLFIPIYNCAKQIKRMVDKIDDSLQKSVSEILFVDNGSTDNGPAEIKEKLMKMKNVKITLVQNKENYSLGGSHKVAFNYTLDNNFDYCIVMHGDDQADIQDVINCIKSKEYRNYDCFLGSRFHEKSKLINYPKFKIFGNKIFNIFISICMRRKIIDMGAGINMYSKKYLSDRHYLFYPNDLTFNLFLLFHAIHTKAKIKYFPTSWQEFDQTSNAKMFKQAFKIFKLQLRYLFKAKSIFSKEANNYSEIYYSWDKIYSNK